MKRIYIIFNCLFSFVLLAQDGDQNTSDDELIVYPIKKFVNNYYDSSIREKLYKKSLSTFEESIEILIQEFASDMNMDVSDYKKTDYFHEDVISFSNARIVNRRFKAYDVPAINVLGVDFKNKDTSFFRALYKEGVKNVGDKLKETTIQWEVYNFKTIPIKINRNSGVTQILDVQMHTLHYSATKLFQYWSSVKWNLYFNFSVVFKSNIS